MNGFIYPIINCLISKLYYLNIVVYFKWFSEKIALLFKKEKYAYTIIAIDIYQLFKFGIVGYFWIEDYNNDFSKYFTYYLIWSNLFIYFYYHAWGANHKQRSDKIALKKNFINFMFAVTFYILSYAYLYQNHYADMIAIDKSFIDVVCLDWINAIYLSTSTALTLTYSGFQPLTQEIRIVFLTQLFNTVLFLTIIITNSIPKNFDKG